VSALAHLFPPKHHQRALPILHEALSISRDNIRSLFAQAYILQTAQDWISAAQTYQKIVYLLPGDLKDGLQAKEDLGWCHWQATHELSDVERMKSVLSDLEILEGRNHDTARCLWRIGKCYWDLGGQWKS
jgi:superkiller protein 3